MRVCWGGRASYNGVGYDAVFQDAAAAVAVPASRVHRCQMCHNIIGHDEQNSRAQAVTVIK